METRTSLTERSRIAASRSGAATVGSCGLAVFCSAYWR